MATTTRFFTTGPPGNSVFRWVEGPELLLLEKWDGEGWKHWPDLIAASGMGGDTSYEVITKAEADRLMLRSST